jgi:hypothetical protein
VASPSTPRVESGAAASEVRSSGSPRTARRSRRSPAPAASRSDRPFARTATSSCAT